VKKKEPLDDKIIDKRVIEKKLRTGDITEEQLNEYLDKLPDVSDNAEEFVIELENENR